jgi:hypothetical protein
MDGMKKAYGKAGKDRSGATGKGRRPRGYPSAGRNERVVKDRSNGETADCPAAQGVSL